MSHDLTREMRTSSAATSLKTVFIAQSLAIIPLLDPELPILAWYRDRLSLSEAEDLPVDLMRSDNELGLRISTKQALELVQRLPSEEVRKDLLSGPMLLGAIKIGNMVVEGSFVKPNEPLSQFAKHFRNAAAHGDRWHFDKNEPKHPAYTRDVTVEASKRGTRATFDSVGPYEYIRFLDEIEAHFGKLAIEKVIKKVYRRRNAKSLSQIHSEILNECDIHGVQVRDPGLRASLAFYAGAITHGVEPPVNMSTRDYPSFNEREL